MLGHLPLAQGYLAAKLDDLGAQGLVFFLQLAEAGGGETQAPGVDSGDAADEPRANATY